MDNKKIIAGVLTNEHTTIPIEDVCQACNISEEKLLEMLEHGLCTHHIVRVNTIYFDEKALRRIQAASRIQRDLDINVPGVVLVLELLDQLEQLRNELNILQHHVGKDCL